MAALDAGVMSIEHGFIVLRLRGIAEKMNEMGAYITTNLTAFDPGLLDIPAVKNQPSSLAKASLGSADLRELHPEHEGMPGQARVPDRLRGHGRGLQHSDCLRKAPQQRVLRLHYHIDGHADLDRRRDRCSCPATSPIPTPPASSG